MSTKPKKLKNGTHVEVARRHRNGTAFTSRGRVAGHDDLANGTWASVNLAEKGKNAILIRCRPSQMKAVPA